MASPGEGRDGDGVTGDSDVCNDRFLRRLIGFCSRFPCGPNCDSRREALNDPPVPAGNGCSSLRLWLLLLLAFRERGFYDPGSLWHVKVGEIILDGRAARRPTRSATRSRAGRWIPQQWGAEVLMALAHRAGGLDTMLLGVRHRRRRCCSR